MPDPQRPARIGFLLAQLGAYAAGLFAEQTAPLGVTPAEAGTIRIIGRSPGISQREVAARMGIGQSRVVALLDRLEQAGLSTRTRRSGDRRVQEVELTAAGRALLTDLRRAAEAQEHQLTVGLDEQRKAALHDLLAELVALRHLDAEVHSGTRHSAPEGG